MAVSRTIAENSLNPLKGWGANLQVVDYVAPVAGTPSDYKAGMCVYLNASGKFALGCPAGATSKVNVPIFLFQYGDDPDVGNSYNPGTQGGWQGINGGNMLGLVGCGSYELETTEFDAAVYAPGDALRAGVDGKLEKGTRGTDMIVGSVSSGERLNKATGKQMLAFWPLVVPPMV